MRAGPGLTLLALLAGLLTVTAAQAERLSTFKIGNWDGGAYSHSQTGRFSHCAASASYRSGITLLFSIDGDLSWAFGLLNRSWKLTIGVSYPVRYWVDRSRDFVGTATAVTENQVKVALPGDDRLFRRVRRGRLLTVVAANQTMKFSLRSTNRMLSTLFDCAKYWRAYDPGARENPFSNGAPANPFDPGSSGEGGASGNPFSKPEATAAPERRAGGPARPIGFPAR